MDVLALVSTLASLLALCFAFLAWRAAAAPKADPAGAQRLDALAAQVERVPALLRDETDRSRQEQGRQAVGLREEVVSMVDRLAQTLDGRFTTLNEALGGRMAEFGAAQKSSSDGLAAAHKTSSETLAVSQKERLDETNAAVRALADRLEAQGKAAQEGQTKALEKVRETLEREQKAGRDQARADTDKVRETLTQQLETLRKENDAKLEQMRATVDEKLQGTLEKRLGESFKQVSERLETVHKSMGEMQALATGVGDLKRVLVNVKARGTWGEVQLGALLEDMLSADQYLAQAQVGGGREAVDYAVRFPGPADGQPVLIPIDCKFPHEDYERLLQAQDAGDPAAVETAGKALEKAIRIQAKSIGDKYVNPPATTNFAIMYLPTEGLYAEVVRRPGLMGELRQKHNVTVAGPTTLTALLDSFRMGFRTLAIAKQANEVWRVLGEAKSEFEKYGLVWDKLVKQLDTARSTAEVAGKRTKAITRRLRAVETLEQVPATPATPLLLETETA